ncbi:MAG: hypothetical protein BAJALOKI1v1_930009 [Promethearchaeota archaeon]|nr:MAG: hypothetical protein BAJALOKI1v1_930009 [Candidatus Lokiarchaeota archaeon]
MHRKCINCGNPLSDDEIVCEKCGVENIITERRNSTQNKFEHPSRVPNFRIQDFDLVNSELNKRYTPKTSCSNCKFTTLSYHTHSETSIGLNGIRLNEQVVDYNHPPQEIICNKYNFVVYSKYNPEMYEKRFGICDSYEGITIHNEKTNTVKIEVKCTHCGKKMKVINNSKYFKVVRCDYCKKYLTPTYTYLLLQVAKCRKCQQSLRTKQSKSRIVIYKDCNHCGTHNKITEV